MSAEAEARVAVASFGGGHQISAEAYAAAAHQSAARIAGNMLVLIDGQGRTWFTFREVSGWSAQDVPELMWQLETAGVVAKRANRSGTGHYYQTTGQTRPWCLCALARARHHV